VHQAKSLATNASPSQTAKAKSQKSREGQRVLNALYCAHPPN
jgi:hypothetical protein